MLCRMASKRSASHTPGGKYQRERRQAQTGETMPKTARHLWPQITSFANIWAAWYEARKKKRYKPEALRFAYDLERNLFGAQECLLRKTWEPQTYRQFWVYEPKPRLIQAPRFFDRVIHHALFRVVNPYFERRFIFDSCACRPGRGTLFASNRLLHFIHQAQRMWGRVYVLKADISRYFPHIRHDLLKAQVRRTIGCPDTLWLFDRFIDGCGFGDCGLPIGALPSQLLANIYLDPIDHMAKEVLRLRFYVRYMDDFIVLGPDKASLYRAKDALGTALDSLGLHYNPKTHIFPLGRGIDFTGYRHFPGVRLPRKRNVLKVRRRVRQLQKLYAQGRASTEQVRATVHSFLAYAKHCACQTTVRHLLDEWTFSRAI